MSLQDHVMSLQMYRQLFCTIDERRLTLYKYDFFPTLLIYIFANHGDVGAPINKSCF